MTSIETFNEQANANTDREHQEQLELLVSLCKAVENSANASEVARMLDDLIAYSEAHFMSEELLMRMKSYDDYEEHLEDHVQMLESLRNMAARSVAGHPGLLPEQIKEMSSFIRRHIATRDKRLADYVRTGQ